MSIWWKLTYILYDVLFIGEIVIFMLRVFELIDWNWLWVLFPMIFIGLLTMLITFIIGNIILAIDGYKIRLEKENTKDEKN